MTKKILPLLLVSAMVFTGCVGGPADTTFSTDASSSTQQSALPSQSQTLSTAPESKPSQPKPDLQEAVYLGVEHYGSLSKHNKDAFIHLFYRNGQVIRLKIAPSPDFAIQNRLMEGYIYLVELEGDTLVGITPAEPVPVSLEPETTVLCITTAPGGAQVVQMPLQPGQAAFSVGKNHYTYRCPSPYIPPVRGTPGLQTLKNFLATAMMPVGTALYVYGGGWDWQDVGSSVQATTIGLPESWVRFFQSQDSSYHYNHGNAANSYFPHGGWNQYYYAGADCSGYVGWAVYNTLNSESGKEGYVGPSTAMAGKLAQLGFGSLVSGDLQPGDILSMQGHVYISLGTCPDGSVVILHSTPNTSGGAGVQLSAIGPNKNCQAYALASRYMTECFPLWAQRYEHQVLCLSPSAYAPTAHFRWNRLSDPEGMAQMTPQQVLQELFGI